MTKKSLSVLPGAPSSQIPTPSAQKRTTKHTSSDVKSLNDDELNLFLLKDAISFSGLKDELIIHCKKFPQSIFAVALGDAILVQSKHYETALAYLYFSLEYLKTLYLKLIILG